MPDDIPYPVDLRLLNEAREATEEIIDELFQQLQGKINRKPCCNWEKAHNRFLAIIKKKRPKRAEIREAKRFQLHEIRRNLKAIDSMIACGATLSALKLQQHRKLLITSEIYRQQQEMYDPDSRRIDDRIVNLSKPHVRPIVRGKAGKQTEFGAKISISNDNGFVDVDRISWDNYNEANDLIARAEQYKSERGYYPERICADAIYMTFKNKRFCEANGIKLSGRARRKKEEPVVQTAEQQELFKSDLKKRSVIEGRIGTSKRKYGLDRIMTASVDKPPKTRREKNNLASRRGRTLSGMKKYLHSFLRLAVGAVPVQPQRCWLNDFACCPPGVVRRFCRLCRRFSFSVIDIVIALLSVSVVEVVGLRPVGSGFHALKVR